MESTTVSSGAVTQSDRLSDVRPRDPGLDRNDGPARARSRRLLALLESTGIVVVAAACTLGLALLDRGLLPLVPVVACAVLLVDIWTLSSYERVRSWRPLRRLAWVSSLALLAGAAVDWLAGDSLRLALAAVLAVAVVPAGVRAGERLFGRPSATLLVGDRVAVSHLIAQWGSRPEVTIAGICLCEPDDETEQPSDVFGYPVVGRLASAAAIAKAHALDQVVVAPGPVLTAYDVRRLSWALEGSDVELAVAAEVHGAVPRRIEPRLLGRRLLLSVRPASRGGLAGWIKALVDRSVSGLLLLLTLPLLASLALAVRVDSAGPAVFRQVRAGRGGTPFTMFKLRTMATDAEEKQAELDKLNEGAGPLFKMLDDPRVTRIGKFLRRTSLDELPQLWNVLRGDMSLIGPRPALPRETDVYDDWIRRRLSVRPGMTGLWQVSGRSRLTWNQAVRLDLDYVDNWTLGGDLDIARRTLRAVVRGEGAS